MFWGGLSREVGRNTVGMPMQLLGIPPLIDNIYPSEIGIRGDCLAGVENACISF